MPDSGTVTASAQRSSLTVYSGSALDGIREYPVNPRRTRVGGESGLTTPQAILSAGVRRTDRRRRPHISSDDQVLRNDFESLSPRSSKDLRFCREHSGRSRIYVVLAMSVVAFGR